MKNLKTCVVIAAELVTAVGSVLEDKKLAFAEIIGIAPELIKIPKFISSIGGAIDELRAGVTPEYQAEINEAVAAKLDLQNDKAEKITEVCISWIIVTASTVTQFAEIIKKS